MVTIRKRIGELILLTGLGMAVLLQSTWAGFSECDNSNATILNCSGQGLTDIPAIHTGTNMPDDFKILDFSNNKLTRIPQINVTSHNTVRALYLNNNRISAIDTEAFKEMRQLIKLDLSMNKLTGDKLEEHEFDNLQSIDTLIMKWNPLRFLPKDTFGTWDFVTLKYFDLSHCEINHIEVGALNLQNLRHLNLSWNDLESFQAPAFNRLRNLLTLDLSHNKLTVINSMPVLPVIQIINLDYNNIRTVSLREHCMFATEMLQQLYIRNNKIQSFTKDSFPWALELLDGIFLDNNPIVCDCRLSWVVTDEDIRNGKFKIPCHSPPELKGKDLLTIPTEQLQCSFFSDHKIHVPVSFMVILIIAILVAFLISVYRTVKRKWPSRCRFRTLRSRSYGGANYTSVYTKEGEDIKVYAPGYRRLRNDGQEFDV